MDDKTPGPFHLALPDLTTVRPATLANTVIAAVLIFKLRWSIMRALGICAALGLVAAPHRPPLHVSRRHPETGQLCGAALP
ncbi:hypothetical protein [Streptomyces sp. NPDC058579]|uniref:hypothetical protein n=1 Tax=Streptomyces sp. NPDC058579 TaxID=3346548 RepID=UPI003652B8C2